MTGRIKKLPKAVYDLIAAGEVVTAPLSVVRELTENAIDAGATRITVEIEDGGIRRVRVTDNGIGIAAEELPLAFAPHATSKIEAAEDLGAIRTLGFRGEALASIAAVAQVTVETKTKDAETGVKQQITATEAGPLLPVGIETGTALTVESLFFNLPARRKNLNAPRTEAARIVDFLSKAAVCYPQIGFRLLSSGSLLFATRGDGDRFSAITTVYGTGVAATLVALPEQTPDGGNPAALRLSGYIADPTGLRATRKGQILFVNGRAVGSAVADRAIDRAYREFAEPGRFPVTFLFLEIDPAFVDVNVHPAKSEVAFANDREVEEFIETTLKDTLVSAKSIPTLRQGRAASADPIFRLRANPAPTGDRTSDAPLFYANADKTTSQSDTQPEFPEETLLVSTSGGEADEIESVDINLLLSNNQSEYPTGEMEAPPATPGRDPGTGPRKTIAREENPDWDMLYHAEQQQNGLPEQLQNTLSIASLQVVASLFATYLLATTGDTVYLIDQHAAHERINYERFLKASREAEPPRQFLLTPHLFTLPAAARPHSEPLFSFLERLGYEIDEFGEDTFAARSFPAFLSQEEAIAFLNEALAEDPALDGTSLRSAAALDGTSPESHAQEERLVMRACKASVKANRILTPEETAALLRDLAACDNPYTCPHGRPVFLKLSKGDLERMFKRA